MIVLFQQQQRMVQLPIPEDRREFLVRLIRMKAAQASVTCPSTGTSQHVLVPWSFSGLEPIRSTEAAWKQLQNDPS